MDIKEEFEGRINAYTGQYVPAKPEYLCQCKRA